MTRILYRIHLFIATLTPLLLAGLQAHAQLAAGDAFIKGQHVEIGIGASGTFGSTYAAPSGFHGRSGGVASSTAPAGAIGFIADPDKDGWGVGTPTYFGDYFLPASPYAGWGIRVGTSQAYADRDGGGTYMTTGLTGSNTGYSVSGKRISAMWQGTYSGLNLSQTVYIDTANLYFVVNFKFKNPTTDTIKSIYYMQSVNPDNEAAITNNLNTLDTIRFQTPNTENKTLITATGDYYHSYLGLGAKDCRAKVYRFAGGWGQLGVSLQQIYDGTYPASGYFQYSDGYSANNAAIGIVFNLGNIAPGDSTSVAYAYILRQEDLDSALNQVKPNWTYNSTTFHSNDTIRACAGSTITLNIDNGSTSNWTWDTSSTLTGTSGMTRNVTVTNTPKTYRAIGVNKVTACGSGSDTLTVVVASYPSPENVSITPVSTGICTGDSINLTGSFTYPADSSGAYLSPIYGPSGSKTACNCPDGYVAVGYTGRTGSWLDQMSLVCKQLYADGTLGATTVVSPSNGVSSGGGPNGPYLFSGTTVLTGATILDDGSDLSAITGYGMTVADIFARKDNTLSTTTLSMLAGSFTTYTTGTLSAPNGYVVTGMNSASGAYYSDGFGLRFRPIGVVANNYSWSSGDTSKVIKVKTTGTFTLTVTNGYGCSTTSAPVTITVNPRPAAPGVRDTAFCLNTAAPALTATGTQLKWYPDSVGGTATTAPTPITTAVGVTSYYVSQTNDTTGCEGPRAKINVTINDLPAIPTAVDTVYYCQNAVASALTATGVNLKWYNVASGGSGSTTAPTPITTAIGLTTYYVAQNNTTTGCEGPRKAIAVRIKTTPGLPAVVTPVNYCAGAAPTALTATGTGLKWYTDSTGGASSATAPVPAAATAGVTNYYVSQSYDTTGCEGPRAQIVVTVNNLPLAPTAADTVAICQNAAAAALTATGTNLKWYTVATGGTSSSTAPVPVTTSTGYTTYYVSQTNGTSCEGPRKAIVVRIKSTPAAPTVTTPLTYCSTVTATALTATGTSLKWYNVATGGSGSTTAPTPATTAAGSTTYYVSQTDTITGCEGPRASIVVTVNATPDSPAVITPVVYCQNAAVALTATGSSLKWYTAATGGTGSTTAPTPTTSSSGNTSYYVSQTSSASCESKRSKIVVTINALPAKPTVTTPVTYCQNAAPVALTATGTSLLWYTASTGGTGGTTAPTPTTTTAGTTTYYVTQTSSSTSCESQRASIDVVINPLPAAPTVTTPVNLCQGVTAGALTATGTTLLWYTGATGGTGSSAAPTPPTISLGTTTYYVSQTSSLGCEGPRKAIAAVVNEIPAAPGVTTPIDLCIGVTPSALTATGINLKWYAAASGGTGSASAPVPAVASTGTFNYYVSQTSNVGCESPRATIVTNVHPSPLLTITPIAAPDFVYCTGATVTIQANAPTAISYQWQRASADLPGETADTLVTGANDYYGVRVTDIYGCKTTKAVFVFKDTLRKPDLAPTNVLMCNGVNIMLYCTPANTTYTYLWSKDGVPMSGTGTKTAATSMSETGSYSVVVTDYYGCTTTTNTSTISDYPSVPKPYITRTDNVLRLSNSYASQQWYRNYVPIASATGRSFTLSFDGTYYAQVFDVNGCTEMSDTITVVALGIPEVNNPQQQVRIYPNPTQGKVMIEANATQINVLVTDVTGREILRKKDIKEVDLSEFSDGMYLFTVTDKDGLLLTKQKVNKLSTNAR